MAKGLFITATGTDIGKTYVTALIMKKFLEYNVSAGYYKAALSGGEENNGIFIPSDAYYVKKVSGSEQNLHSMVSYFYRTSVSPHLAAHIEGNSVEMENIKNDFNSVCSKFDYVTVEGSGGIVCPIRFDKDCKIMLEDIIIELGLPVLIVADGGLGTINSVTLTAEHIRNNNIPIKGIILNNFENKCVMHRDNLEMIEELSGVPVIATVENEAENIDIDIEILKLLYDELG